MTKLIRILFSSILLLGSATYAAPVTRNDLNIRGFGDIPGVEVISDNTNVLSSSFTQNSNPIATGFSTDTGSDSNVNADSTNTVSKLSNSSNLSDSSDSSDSSNSNNSTSSSTSSNSGPMVYIQNPESVNNSNATTTSKRDDCDSVIEKRDSYKRKCRAKRRNHPNGINTSTASYATATLLTSSTAPTAITETGPFVMSSGPSQPRYAMVGSEANDIGNTGPMVYTGSGGSYSAASTPVTYKRDEYVDIAPMMAKRSVDDLKESFHTKSFPTYYSHST